MVSPKINFKTIVGFKNAPQVMKLSSTMEVIKRKFN